jgi:predicted small metal-binding protein
MRMIHGHEVLSNDYPNEVKEKIKKKLNFLGD